MLRLKFEKLGNAVWISHLDLMRLFQRAFKRAGLPLTHTQGYNPRPSVSIALPLSVGVESVCELLDFQLEGEAISCEQIRDKLNQSLVEGVKVLEVYEGGRKLKDLAYLNCQLMLFYDCEIPEGAEKRLQALFTQDRLPVMRKSKNGPQEQDMIPMIRSVAVCRGEGALVIDCCICCQNPSLNPMQFVAAIECYLPELQPDQVLCKRLSLLDHNFEEFR